MSHSSRFELRRRPAAERVVDALERIAKDRSITAQNRVMALSALDDARTVVELEQLLDELHEDHYRDVLKYVVYCHPQADGLKGMKTEHPGHPEIQLHGQGATWTEAARNLLEVVRRHPFAEPAGTPATEG